MTASSLLTILLLVPLAGAAAVSMLPATATRAIKLAGIGASLAAFGVSLALWFMFDAANPAMQFVERIPWIPGIDVTYHVGIDGISLLLVVLTTFLIPIALLASWESVTRRLRGYVALMLLLEVGTLGVFVSLDLVLFYVF